MITEAEFRKKFLESTELIMDISEFGIVPEELFSQDVYDCLYFFKNRETAINYVIEKYGCNFSEIDEQLHECENDKKSGLDLPLSAQLNYDNLKDTHITELNDGLWVLWIAY